MKDQAEELRKRTKEREHHSVPKTMAVVSGKGGVGKSNFSLNFALSLLKRGHKVLLFDMDVGMGNIDILLGKTADFSIVDFLEGKQSLQNIVTEGPNGLRYIAGGTGLQHLVKLDEALITKFMDELSRLLVQFEFVIFDMGAGVTQETLNFILSVDEIIVVTTPEPTSITDAYSIMKHIHLQNSQLPFLIVVNRVVGDKDGVETFKRLRAVTRRFLGRDVDALGMIPDDRAIQKAVSTQTPFIFNDKSMATKALMNITERYEAHSFKDMNASNSFGFVSKLKRFLFER